MKALLVMDMVNEYIYGKRPLINIKKRPKLISNIKKVIGVFHKKKIPVIYVNSAFRKDDPILKVIGYRPQAMEGKIGKKKLFKQCNFFLNLFGIPKSDLVSVSYSDLLLEK